MAMTKSARLRLIATALCMTEEDDADDSACYGELATVFTEAADEFTRAAGGDGSGISDLADAVWYLAKAMIGSKTDWLTLKTELKRIGAEVRD